MTRLYVDAREVPCPSPDPSTLEEILRHVEQNHLPPESVVRQVSVDGMPLGVDQLERGRIRLRESIEIVTGSLREVAAESLEEAVSYLARVETGIPRLAADLQEFPGPAEYDSLKQLYEGLFWLSLLMDRLCSALHIDLGRLLIGGTSASIHHRRLAAALKRLIDAQEDEDFATLASLLESDIRAMVPIWRDMFLEISARAKSPH